MKIETFQTFSCIKTHNVSMFMIHIGKLTYKHKVTLSSIIPSTNQLLQGLGKQNLTLPISYLYHITGVFPMGNMEGLTNSRKETGTKNSEPKLGSMRKCPTAFRGRVNRAHRE